MRNGRSMIPVAVLLLGTACGRPNLAPPVEAAETTPQVVEVTCDGSSTKVANSVVKPQPDGVHFDIVNSSGADLSFQWAFSGGGGGDNAPEQKGTLVVPMPPPGGTVDCSPAASASEPSEAQGVMIKVVDPDGLWTSDSLECPDGSQVTGSGSVEAHDSNEGDPVEIARAEFHGLEPNDVVERAGYPESSERKVRVVRDGRVIAMAEYWRGEGGWYRDNIASCGEVQ